MNGAGLADKLPVLAVYACLLALVAFAPGAAGAQVFRLRSDFFKSFAIAGIAFLSTFFLVVIADAASIRWTVLCMGFALFSFIQPSSPRSLPHALMCISLAGISLALPWWVEADEYSWGQVVACLAICAICHVTMAFDLKLSRKLSLPVILSVVITAACVIAMHLAPIEAGARVMVAWHHWGAYLGPAESMSAGLIPFVDIPLQYGLGPTLLLSTVTGPSGFDGMHWIVLACTAAGIFVATHAALTMLARAASITLLVIGAMVLAVSCLLWTASPAYVSTAMMTPSTFGLRFALPLVLLWLVICFPHRRGLAFAAWLVCAGWSIEVAFYGCAIFWTAQLPDAWPANHRDAATAMVRMLLKAAGITAIVMLVYFALLWLAFGSPPDLKLYAIYAISPPTPYPIRWSGSIWWVVAISVFSLCVLFRTDIEEQDKRSVRLCAIALLAFTSYFLGRSHDNNIANLMPAAALAICALVGATTRTGGYSALSRQLLITPLALVPLFGFEAWHDLPQPSATAWSRNMSFEHNAPKDLQQAIAYVREIRQEHFDLVDYGANVNMDAQGAEGVWQGLHPMSNFPDVPSDVRREIARRAAEKLNRPGWLIVEESLLNDGRVQDLRSVYVETQRFRSGRFVGIRLAPRQTAASKLELKQ